MRQNRYFLKYCTKGHMIYAKNRPVEGSHCRTCGSEFVEKCNHCGEELGNGFYSYEFSFSGEPASIPARPQFCKKCGAPYPWTKEKHAEIEQAGFWAIMNPKVENLAKSRFVSGHYADAVESVFKELNNEVKHLYFSLTGEELDGVALMRKAFTSSKPVIFFEELDSETGKNIQQGYMDIFAGAMAGIRNPKAHNNVRISAEEAIHYLMLASLLFNKLEKRKKKV